MNSSMVTTPSLFLSIFCKKVVERENSRDGRRQAGRTQVSSLLGPHLLPFTPGPSSLPSPKHLEEALHMFPWGLLPECRICILAHHVIDGLHDIKHFLLSQERRGSLLRASSLETQRPRGLRQTSPLAGDIYVGHISPLWALYTSPPALQLPCTPPW